MDESSLRTLIDSLDSQQDASFHWLNVCAALVVIGVLAEIVFVIWAYWSERGDWQHGIGFLRPPRPPNFIKLILELIGVLLVSGGVAGEFFVDRKAGAVETQLRKANADLVLLLGKKAQDAATSAHNAVVDAGNAYTLAQEASDMAGVAQGKADTAMVSAARTGKLAEVAKDDAAKAQQYAIDVKGELEKDSTLLQAASAVSPSSSFDFLDLIDELRKLPPMTADILYRGDDADAKSFADLVYEALNDSGWKVPKPAPSITILRYEKLDLSGSGTIIFNNFASAPAPPLSIDDWRFGAARQTEIDKLESQGLSADNAKSLVILSLTIGADLKQRKGPGLLIVVSKVAPRVE
jgi:hypothetical protein